MPHITARPTKTECAELAGAITDRLLSIMREGRPAFGADGSPIVDENGHQMFRPASPADIREGRSWLAHNKHNASTAEHDSMRQIIGRLQADQLKAEAASRGLRFDSEADDELDGYGEGGEPTTHTTATAS